MSTLHSSGEGTPRGGSHIVIKHLVKDLDRLLARSAFSSGLQRGK